MARIRVKDTPGSFHVCLMRQIVVDVEHAENEADARQKALGDVDAAAFADGAWQGATAQVVWVEKAGA